MLLSDKRIFIVEDNTGNLAIASLYLEHHGAKIRLERRGKDVPKAILNHMPIDIVLMDLMLPNGVSGFDIFDQIREVPELAQIPVVIVSAADPDLAIPQARKRGVSGYISKPVTPHIPFQVADVLNGKTIWIAESSLSF